MKTGNITNRTLKITRKKKPVQHSDETAVYPYDK